MKQNSLSGALNVLNALNKNKTINDYLTENINSDDKDALTICNIDPNNIERWQYKDRPQGELGDISKLANEIKNIGQQQPCIVRKLENGKYELLVGERRWLAAKEAQINLKAVIQNISDSDAALIQVAENDSRLDLSDFAKGMSLSKLIQNGIIKQKSLETKLGKSKQEISRLLSFSKIDATVFEAIKDFHKVTSRTAYEVSRLSKKGGYYVSALIKISSYIREGKYGANKIIEEVNKYISKETPIKKRVFERIFNEDGVHLFTWKTDSNKNRLVFFPKKISKLIEEEKIDIRIINEAIKKEIMRKT